MNELNGKKIIIFQQRGWAMTVGQYLAEKLQEQGCRLAALTLKKETHQKIINQNKVKYDYIINVDEILENPEKFTGNNNISLEEICRELNIDSIWPMLTSNRLLTKSYKDKFYYSFRQNVPDEFIVNYVKAHYMALRDLFEKFKPDAVFAAAFIYDGHIMLSLLADKYNIPIISIADSKVQGYYMFTNSYNTESGPFFDQLENLNNNKVETKNRNKAREYIRGFRKKFKNPVYAAAQSEEESFIKKIKHSLSPYKQIFLWYAKGRYKNRISNLGVSIDCKPPRIILRDYYCKKKYKKFLDNFDYYPLEKISKCAYFPLQFQPEGAIDLSAPYFSNQIETARQIAMSLPDDYTLAVKEHPGMAGLRTPAYLKKLANTPNVKLIDYRINSDEILKKADIIISPSGTSIAEAAFFNKPAVQLGNLGTTLKLPNVFHHTDMATLSKKIKELLSMDLNNSEYERRLENYVAAAFDAGFNINYHKAWEGKGEGSRGYLIDLFISEIKRKII